METSKSFEGIMMKLSPTLRRITYRLNGHFTFFDEDDLYQEALRYLWTAFRNGSLGDKTDSYVLQGCYFYLKNYIRKTMDKARVVSIDSPIDEDGSTIKDTLSCKDNRSEDAADDIFLRETLRTIGLTEREKRVLSLSLSGMTVREIGEDLGISHVMVIKIRAHIRMKYTQLRDIGQDGYQN